MSIKVVFCLGIVAAMLSFGCGSDRKDSESAGSSESPGAERQKEPDAIAVQHILIGFHGTLPGKPVARTMEEAEKLAGEILDKVRSGEDFDGLVRQYTDDSYPGVYRMANFDVAADPSEGVYPRSGMVPAFGDVGFSLEVGGVAVAPYSQEKSPFGWHIIKRIE
jgi:hypothetical protein